MSLATFRDRLRRKVRRMIEPIAHDLLAWAQGAENRFANIESKLAGLDDRLDALNSGLGQHDSRLETLNTHLVSHDMRLISHDIHASELDSHLRELESQLVIVDNRLGLHESRLGRYDHGLNVFESRLGEFDSRQGNLDAIRQQAVWERQAIIERLNRDDAREEVLGSKISSLEHVVYENMIKQENTIERLAASEVQLDQAFWSRFAVVERLNQIDARDEWKTAIFDAKFQTIDASMAEVRLTIETQASLPTASELDSLAMGRRLAALEDEIERLLNPQPDQSDKARRTDLVSFPSSIGDDSQ